MTISDKINAIKNGQSKLNEGFQEEPKKSVYLRIMENVERWITSRQKCAVVYPDKFFGYSFTRFSMNSLSALDMNLLTEKEKELCTYLENTEGLELLIASFGQEHVIFICL